MTRASGNSSKRFGIFSNAWERLLPSDRSTSDRSKKRTDFSRPIPLKRKPLRLESLEERMLLAVTTPEFEQIRNLYADLYLSANMTDYNVIEIPASQLSAATLQAKINEAANTAKNDLIVVRTTSSQNTITYASAANELQVYGIDAATRGSVTIVSLGASPLTINAAQKSRVLNITSSTVALAGLTITGGQATYGHDGGGIGNYEGTLTVTNSTITGNKASYGGGIYNYEGALMVTNSTISKNTVSFAGGGGICNKYGTVTVMNCTIAGNTASSSGGGIDNYEGTLTVTNSTISGNTASYGFGGGINNDEGTLTVTNSTISGNTATSSYGGGIGNVFDGTATVTNSTISGNTASYGGGIFNYINGTLTATNSLVSGNTASSGGGIDNYAGTLTVTNSTISGNTASSGGGIHQFYYTSRLTVTNSTISGNTASRYGGGIYNYSGTLTATNSTISGNTASRYGGGIYDYGDGTLTVMNSTISGNTASERGGGIYRRAGLIYLVGTSVSGNTAPLEYCTYEESYEDENGDTKYRTVREDNDDSDDYGNCCTWNSTDKTWEHLTYVKNSLPAGFSLPGNITAAIIVPVLTPLRSGKTITLDGSQSINAANYYWDLNNDGKFNDATGAIITLGGPGATGVTLSWEQLQALGWKDGHTYTVALKTVVAGSNQSEKDPLKFSITKISITVDGIVSYVDAAPERLAKDVAYLEWTEGQRIDFGPDGVYVVARVFGAFRSQLDGFYAIGLTKENGTSPLLIFRGTEGAFTTSGVNDWYSNIIEDWIGQRGYNAHRNRVFAWLDEVSVNGQLATLTGHSRGGALAQAFAAGYTSRSSNPGTLKAVYTFNSPGISADMANRFVKSRCAVVEHHIVEGDVVSLGGEAFILADTIFMYNYIDGAAAKHSCPVTVADIREGWKPSDRLLRPADLTWNTSVTTDMLNSYFFHYPELAINADAFYIRGSAESLRRNKMSWVVYKFPESSYAKGWKLQDINDTLNTTNLTGSVELVSPTGVVFDGTIFYSQYGINFLEVDLSKTLSGLEGVLRVTWNGTQPGDMVYRFLGGNIVMTNPTVRMVDKALYEIGRDSASIMGYGTYFGVEFFLGIDLSKGKMTIYRNGVAVGRMMTQSDSGWEMLVDNAWVPVSVMGGGWQNAVYTQTGMGVVFDFAPVGLQGMDSQTEIVISLNETPTWITTVGELQTGKATFSFIGLNAGTYTVTVRANDGSHYPALVTLAGTLNVATVAEVSVIDTSGFATDATVSFGARVPNAAVLEHLTHDFILKNEGTAPLTLTDWSLDGNGLDAFLFAAYDTAGNQVGFGDFRIMPGESLVIRVGVTHQENTGSLNNFILTVKTNDATQSTLKLTGSVIFVDTVGTVTVPTGGITVSSTASGAYQVVLNSQPTSNVTVYIHTNFGGLVTNVGSLVFTSSNWNTPRTVNLSFTDANFSGNATAIVSHSVISSDIAFLVGGISDVVVTVTNCVYLSIPKPGNVSAISSSEIVVNWSAVPNASGYTIQYRKVGDSTWTTISSVTSPRSVTGLTAGTQYEFQLKAVGSGSYSDSAWSSSQTIWTLCAQPTGVSATAQSSNSITINWTATTGAASYIVERSANGSSGWTTVGTPTTNTYPNTGLTASTTYYYRVTAVNPSGNSTVSATVNATTGSTSTSITVTNTNSGGAGSLRQAIADAPSGGTISFAGNLAGQTISLAGTELAINKSITIDASNLYNAATKTPGITISGNNTSRVFSISGNSTNASLVGLIITGGNASSGGGIDNFSSTLTVTNSTISGNTASYGGGISSSYGTLSVTNSTISGNTANTDGSGGGGIHSFSGTLSVTNCTISGNTASSSGGGIYSYGYYDWENDKINGGTLTVNNCTISDNTAVFGGGIDSSNGTLTVTGSEINGNTASYGGGGICSNGDALSVTGSTISGNNASYNGGGISSFYGTLTVTNSTINGNNTSSSPYSYGGGIYSYDGTLTITNSTVSGNNASSSSYGYGGGIYSYGTNSTITVINSTISGNAASTGGGICSRYGTLSVTNNSTISDNTADYGGGIYGRYGTLSVTNSTISGNTAFSGGGIYSEDGTLSVTNNSTINNNTASTGGGIYNFSGTVTITNSTTISGNTANGDGSSGGGGIYNGGTLTVTNSTISGNTANGGGFGGGGVYNCYGTAVVMNSTISGNTHTGGALGGGGIFNYDGTLSVTNSTIAGNTANGGGFGGGGIYSSNGTLTVTGSTISGNTASYSGGGIYGCYGTLSVTNSTIAGNTANGGGFGGGGIYSSNGTLKLCNAIVAKNSTDVYNESTVTGSNNLIANGTNSGLTHGVNGNKVGTLSTPIDPKFVSIPEDSTSANTGLNYNPSDWDLRLTTGSPAIDAGSNSLALAAGIDSSFKDLAGTPRILYDTIDMGAYEFYRESDMPKVQLPNINYQIQEGCYLQLSANAVGEGLTYWWDISGTGIGNFTEMDASIGLNLNKLGFVVGEHVIKLYVKNSFGIQSDTKSITVQVVSAPPSFRVEKKELLGGQVLGLDIEGYFPGGRVPQSWTINWGDSGANYTCDAKTTFVRAIYYYPQNTNDTAYPITLTIVNSKGEMETYFLGSHVMPGSSPSGAMLPGDSVQLSALPVISMENDWVASGGELFTPMYEGTEFLESEESFIANSVSETVTGYSAVSWFDPAFALVAKAGRDLFTRLSWNEDNLLPTNPNRLVDASLTGWFEDFATDETVVFESISRQLPGTSESKNHFTLFDGEFDYFDTIFEDELLEYAKF